MNPFIAITVFFSLMIPSLFLSYGNYTTAKEHIIADVNRKLWPRLSYTNNQTVING